MTWKCPKCKLPVHWGDRACKNCGFPITVRATARHYSQCFLNLWRPVLFAECPKCHKPNWVWAAICRKCKEPVTPEGTAQFPSVTRVQRWRAKLISLAQHCRASLADPKPRLLWIVQGFYFALSLVVLVWTFRTSNVESTWAWVGVATLSTVAMGFLGALAVLILRREFFRALHRGTSVLVKFCLFLNYFTVVLLLERFVFVWWKLALAVTLVFLSTLGAAFLGYGLLRAADAGSRISFGRSRSFDPQKPQGRQAWRE